MQSLCINFFGIKIASDALLVVSYDYMGFLYCFDKLHFDETSRKMKTLNSVWINLWNWFGKKINEQRPSNML